MFTLLKSKIHKSVKFCMKSPFVYEHLKIRGNFVPPLVSKVPKHTSVIHVFISLFAVTSIDKCTKNHDEVIKLYLGSLKENHKRRSIGYCTI